MEVIFWDDRTRRRRYEAYVESRAREVVRNGRRAAELEEDLRWAMSVLGWQEEVVARWRNRLE